MLVVLSQRLREDFFQRKVTSEVEKASLNKLRTNKHMCLPRQVFTHSLFHTEIVKNLKLSCA